VPLLAILANNSIETLDVTGQELGEEGLFKVFAAAPALREFHFGYFGVSSGDALISVCQKILQSPTITFATFPQREVKPALTKSNVARRPEIARQLGELRQRFLERFGPEADSPDDAEEARFVSGAPHPTRPANQRATPAGESPRTVIAQNLETMKFFADYDEETLALITECGELSGVDPMWRAYVAAMNAIEIPALAHVLKA
jgi:hypothetical protein